MSEEPDFRCGVCGSDLSGWTMTVWVKDNESVERFCARCWNTNGQEIWGHIYGRAIDTRSYTTED
jgi:hypothetical protein